MTILHFAAISQNFLNGVCVVVPQHIIHQQDIANVGFVNINNIHIDLVKNQFMYSNDFKLTDLPEPFCKPDIVVFHEAYRAEYLKIAKIIRDNNIPYIIAPHGELSVVAQKKKWFKKKVANFLLFNRFIYSSCALQCLSEYEYLNTNFNNNKMIATNGIDIPKQMKKSFSADFVRMIYIGRLDVIPKGLDLMLSAIHIIRDKMRENNCFLEIYGPNHKNRHDDVRALIKKYNLDEFVRLHHEIIDKEKSNALLNSDVFIQTSRTEGMPMGILEALSYGVPCIVTRGTALADFVSKHNCGWSCETNVNAIASTLEQCINEKKMFSLKSQSAVRAVADEFNWDRVVESTLEKYRSYL